MRTMESDEIGRALGEAAFERGDRLGKDEHAALSHWSMWGSDGYPVQRAGRKWRLEHALAQGFGAFATRGRAVAAWEALIAKWIRMSGLEAQERAVRAQA